MVNKHPHSYGVGVAQKVFTHRETLTFALRLKNELSTPPSKVEIRDMDGITRDTMMFGGYSPWVEAISYCSADKLQNTLDDLTGDKRVIAVLYDPSLVKNGVYTLCIIFKDRAISDDFLSSKTQSADHSQNTE